jgi:hypothetical protein
MVYSHRFYQAYLKTTSVSFSTGVSLGLKTKKYTIDLDGLE